MVWHPCHTHAAQFCVFCEFCGRTAHPNHLCQSVPSVGEKIFPQNAHTEPSGREGSPTDEHVCSQIRRVWHPCHTHAAKFCEFREFSGRTAHHNNLCSSVPSVGVLSLQEGSVRSVHSVGGVAVVWCSRDCCPPLVVYPCHLWEVLSAIGFRVFDVFCRRSTLIKFVVKNFAPTP